MFGEPCKFLGAFTGDCPGSPEERLTELSLIFRQPCPESRAWALEDLGKFLGELVIGKGLQIPWWYAFQVLGNS